MYKSEQQMEGIVRYIKYEWDRFSWAAYMIKCSILDGKEPDDWEMGTGGGDDTAKSLVEVCLLHARALRDFLNRERTDQGVHKTDVLAVDFFDAPNRWNKLPFPYLMKHKDRVNRALAHLSYDRVGYEVTGRDWDFKVIITEVTDAWQEFLRALPETRRDWFEPGNGELA